MTHVLPDIAGRRAAEEVNNKEIFPCSRSLARSKESPSFPERG
jgi:hypothetical protein